MTPTAIRSVRDGSNGKVGSDNPVPRPRTYLGYTIRAYAVDFRWEVEGEFDPPRNGTFSVGVGNIHSLAEAKKKAREFELEFGRPRGRKRGRLTHA